MSGNAFETATAQHGGIDVLVNNAGIAGPGAIDETPLDFFRRVMETNYFGVLRCIKAVLPGMVARRSGCIINVSSVAGRVAVAPQAPYAASKHALEALSECLAQEVKSSNIRVAIVDPGPIATPELRKFQRAQPITAHPQFRRLAALFVAATKQPTLPDNVADQICRIVDGDNWQLRYPIGPPRTCHVQMARENQRRRLGAPARRKRSRSGGCGQARIRTRFGAIG